MANIIEQEIKNINSNLPQYKIIRYFVLTKEDLAKTTTLKIKRNIENSKMKEYQRENGKDMRKLHKSVV